MELEEHNDLVLEMWEPCKIYFRNADYVPHMYTAHLHYTTLHQ